MEKSGIVKRMVSKTILAGLLINFLPTTLPVRAQQVPGEGRTAQQVSSRMQPKLSKEEIDKKLKNIKKVIRILKAVNIVVPSIIEAVGTIGALVFSVSFASLGIMFFGKGTLFRSDSEKIVKGLALTSIGAIMFIIGTPIFTALTYIGFVPVAILVALAMAGELERMEKKYPGTLTEKQKMAIQQLKKLSQDPIIRATMSAFALKKALKTIVVAAVEKNPELISKIAPGQPKKARKIIARYIKLKRRTESAQKKTSLLAKATEPDLQQLYTIAVKELAKLKQKIAVLEKKYPTLAVAPEVKDVVLKFGQEKARILEELKKPVIEEKQPVVVPL